MVQAVRLSVLSALLSLAALAQRYNGDGYAYYSVNGANGVGFGDLMGAGGGGEAFVFKNLAAAFEAGYLWPRVSPSQGVGLASVNAAYHHVNRDRPGKLVPFATVGYTLGFRSGTANFINYGGGVTWWFNRHVGFRPEVRVVQYTRERDVYAAGLRLGVTFR